MIDKPTPEDYLRRMQMMRRLRRLTTHPQILGIPVVEDLQIALDWFDYFIRQEYQQVIQP